MMNTCHSIKEIDFTILGKPVGKQRPRVVKVKGINRTYTPRKTVDYENLVKLSYVQAAKSFCFPKKSMLCIEIKAYYSIPKSTSKKRKIDMINKKILPIKKPDLDNVAKIICDSLNKLAYHDDSAIIEMKVQKFYDEKARVEVKIREIEL